MNFKEMKLLPKEKFFKVILKRYIQEIIFF